MRNPSREPVGGFGQLDDAMCDDVLDAFVERGADGVPKVAKLILGSGRDPVEVPELISSLTQLIIDGDYLDEERDSVTLSVRSSDLPDHLVLPLSATVTAELATYPGWRFSVDPDRSAWGGAMHEITLVRGVATAFASNEKGQL